MSEVDQVSKLAADAIGYVLLRAQTDPDFRDVMMRSESWERLCAAEAALTGVRVEDVKSRRKASLIPLHRDPTSHRERLEARIEELERQLSSADECPWADEHHGKQTEQSSDDGDEKR